MEGGSTTLRVSSRVPNLLNKVYIVVQLIEWLLLFIPGEDGNDYSLNIGNDEDGGEDKDLNPERDL